MHSNSDFSTDSRGPKLMKPRRRANAKIKCTLSYSDLFSQWGIESLLQLCNQVLLVQFRCFEGASIIIQGPIGHFFRHDVGQSQSTQYPLRPISRGIWMSLGVDREKKRVFIENARDTVASILMDTWQSPSVRAQWCTLVGLVGVGGNSVCYINVDSGDEEVK